MAHRIVGCVLIIALIGGVFGCKAISDRWGKEEGSSEEVALADISAPARATIERLTAGGEIKMLEKEEADGKVVYDVEATVGGKDVEYDVASDGTVLTTEEAVPYASLPTAVQAAAQKYFGSDAGLKASKEIEDSKVFYEVEGKKKGAEVALKLTDTGKIIEVER